MELHDSSPCHVSCQLCYLSAHNSKQQHLTIAHYSNTADKNVQDHLHHCECSLKHACTTQPSSCVCQHFSPQLLSREAGSSLIQKWHLPCLGQGVAVVWVRTLLVFQHTIFADLTEWNNPSAAILLLAGITVEKKTLIILRIP